MKKWIHFLGIVGAVFITAVLADSKTSSYLKMFEKMPPQEQQKIIDQLQNKSAKPQSSPVLKTEPQKVQPAKIKTGAVEAKTNTTQIEENAKKSLENPGFEEKKVEKSVKQELKQFGYDLFNNAPTTFAPAVDIPVPANFVVGPGDTIRVQLFGQENSEFELPVTRDGTLNFPSIGPISVAGLKFDDLKYQLMEKVGRQYIGVKANVSLGALRSIGVFVLGDVVQPGSFTVSSLSNVTNALFYSGGVRPIGSLRQIQLKRTGELINSLDLYDLLLRGDTSGDIRLQPGDVIFIPPIGKTVAIGGEVRRPAIYEMKGERTVGEILKLAGGLLPTAYPNASQLERIRNNSEKTLVDIDLTKKANMKLAVQDGDVIRIYSILEKMEDVVLLSGHVQRPGGVQWHQGMRVSDLLPNAKALLPKADVGYVVVKREVQPSRHIQILTADLEGAWGAMKGTGTDLFLSPRDEVMLFAINEDRTQSMKPIVELLKQQARYGQPEPVVYISGNVRYPGEYPYESGMGLKKLIRAAVDILPRTDMEYTLVARELDMGTRIDTFSVALKELVRESSTAEDVVLQPRDRVFIFNLDENRELQLKEVIAQLKAQAALNDPARIVSVNGHVRSPGAYPFEHQMMVSDLIRAAGNMTEAAYSLDAEITRYKNVNGKHREVEHIPIVLAKIFEDNNTRSDVLLQPYDELNVKLLPEWQGDQKVEILGEVRFPGTYSIIRGESLATLFKRAGGLNQWSNAEGTVLQRESLRRREQQELEKLTSNLEADLASMKLKSGEKTDALDQESMMMAQNLLSQAKDAKAVGRLVVNVPAILAGKKGEDVILKEGDRIYVPSKTQEVTVLGEVYAPTSHVQSKAMRRDDYISLSGGLTAKADKDRIYVVRASGAVIAGRQGWLIGSANIKIKPGDAIVVPMDVSKIKRLKTWTDVTQIIYQLGIGAASWKTVGVF